MIVTTVYLAAAAGGSTDPWHVLGNTYAERLATAALADLTLARLLTVAPADESDSPAARLLEQQPGSRPAGALGEAFDALGASTKRLDIDRGVRLLRDLAPAIEADLVAAGALDEGGQKGFLRKRTVLTARPEASAAAQALIRHPADPTAAEARALVVIATTGLPAKRIAELCGGPVAVAFDPFDSFDPSSPAPDGRALGDNAAELLTALVTVLAATSDSTGDFD